MRGIVIAWAAALATVSCNPSSSPTPEAWQAISSKALKVLLEQINGQNLKKIAPLQLRIRGPPLMMMSAATIGAASSRWIQSREQKDLRYAIKILMAFTIQREAEHIARLGTLESTSRQLVVYGPSTTAQWNSFEILEEALKDVNETVGSIERKLDNVVQEILANQSSAVAKQHMAQMEAAAQLHTEQMAAAAQHHTEQMAAAVQHHQEQKAAAAQQMAAAEQHHREQKLLLCYACAALCAFAILGQMYIISREHMKRINTTIDKKLAPMQATISKVEELGVTTRGKDAEPEMARAEESGDGARRRSRITSGCIWYKDKKN